VYNNIFGAQKIQGHCPWMPPWLCVWP